MSDSQITEELEILDASASFIKKCRVCGCTDNDCLVCIKKQGFPCWWVEADLCSACVNNEERSEKNE